MRPLLQSAPLFALLLLATPAARAATLNVPSAQYPTLQAGINAAVNGDTVLVADGTYTGPGNVDLDFGGKALTVTSANGAASTIIDCQGSSSSPHSGFNFQSGEPSAATVSGLTVKDGFPSLAADNTNTGGGIDIINNSSPTITHCIFTANHFDAVHCVGGAPTITDCTFTGNFSERTYITVGGGLHLDNLSKATITNCAFTHNLGNGMVVLFGSSATVTNCTFTDNGNDGLYALFGYQSVNNVSLTMTHCTFTGNAVGIDGGANATVTDCAFTGNADGLDLELGGNLNIARCAFTGNSNTAINTGAGNGVNITAVITDCAITDNGAVGMILSSNPVVTNCIFIGNGYGDNGNGGGGIDVSGFFGGSPTVTNCTFTGNHALAIKVDTGCAATVTNCVLYGDGGGEVFGSMNTTLTLSYCDVQGGYAGTGNINADPLFVHAPDDLHLQSGSPCLGAGTAAGASAADADGHPRPNPPSIGAYDVPGAYGLGRFDFNRDGRNDLLWQNTSTGQVVVWDMNDQTISAYGQPFGLAAKVRYRVVAVADVNGDGQPDLLWENPDTGQLLFWYLGGANGTQSFYYGSPFAAVPDTRWRVASMADFNGDGNPDILWENSQTGQLLVWYMNSGTVAAYGQPFATVSDTHWRVAGTADFNSDGHPDLLWENSQTGQALVWSMGGAAGTTVLAYNAPFVTVTDTHWHIVGTGDFNGDTHPDLLWENSSTGQVTRWLLGGAGGTQVQQRGLIFAGLANTQLQIVGIH